jgi:putative aminopeptidase FrvX
MNRSIAIVIVAPLDEPGFVVSAITSGSKIQSRVTFAWTVAEETGLGGATYLARSLSPETALAIDTFVSSDTPVDVQRLAGAPLGHGAVLRMLDSRTLLPPQIVDWIAGMAKTAGIRLPLGGGTDASAFSGRIRGRRTFMAGPVLAFAGRSHGSARPRCTDGAHRGAREQQLKVER